MIKIIRSSSEIKIKGHAGYDEPGKDIVCAGVSTLVQTLVQSIGELTSDKIQYSMSPGTVDIRFRNLSERAQALTDSFFVGIRMIADEYPENVQLFGDSE